MINQTETNTRRQMAMRNLMRLPSVACLALTTISLISFSGCGVENVVSDSSVAIEEIADHDDKNSESSSSNSGKTLTRLFWQDMGDGMMYTSDLMKTGVTYKVNKTKVKDFPTFSADENDLVQMTVARGRLIVGVRDHENGSHKSGWIEINTGVEEEDHGDHSHWIYDVDAKVSSSTLDKDQGNPAHVYRYGNHVYIANDKNNGFTQVNPQDGSSRFFSGGGGHITMAAVNDRIAYSTWIDREGENKGRVDVVNLRDQRTEPAYTFHLPVGGIHGAGVCGNRVYFAPSNGVCWVDCDFDFAENADSVTVNHLSLDENSEGTDYRTGAFTSFRDHMLCIAKGKSGNPALCVINATAPNPQVTRISCGDLDDGLKLSTVTATTISGSEHFAYAFAEGDGLDERLLVFELDPNGDRNFGDAKISCSLDVGKSNLQGHFGHHGIAFVGDGKTAVVTNPGDGTLSIIDLVQQKVQQTIDVGGKPTHVANDGKVSN